MSGSTRVAALLLVAALFFMDVAGERFLSPSRHTAAVLILVLGIVLLALRAAQEYRSEGVQTTDRSASVLWPGWKWPAAVFLLSSAATVLLVVSWKWTARADFDVAGVLWLLQNIPGVVLVGIFSLIAMVALSVTARNLGG